MDTNPIDPVLNAFAFSGADFPDANTATEGEPFDAISKLFEDGALAYHLGGNELGHARVERLHEQTAQLDARILKSRQAAPAHSDWDEITDDSHRLEKRDRAIGFYVTWLSNAMEKRSKTSEEIISQWREEFPDAKPEIVQAIQEAAQILATA
jgi:hypothetical protein